MNSSTHKANRLSKSTSPYLLQHAYNPVDWYEWGEEAFAKAKKEDKPVLVSIGYSSCHWCHVMERESFEDDDIAQIMNEFFVCIKVDREERPDIDNIYMEAVQAMGLNGGWPLNVFLTPDQKPFYGGTYFPPQSWAQLLTSIHKNYQSKRLEIETSADELKTILSRSDLERFKQQTQRSELVHDLDSIYSAMASKFDTVWGGLDKAPKFIMPSSWQLLLRYYHLTDNKEALHQVILTLKRITMGGIHDQVGGGFARYSVDAHWFAPHFEKMLYDNAQLMSLYAEAYAVTKDEEFKSAVEDIYDWLQREMTHPDGGFYSALDADSEGEEGKFYVWKKSELTEILGADADLIAEYFSVQEEGNWEHGNNIFIRNKPDSIFLHEKNITEQAWSTILIKAKAKLLAARNTRPKPGLDDKIITSWNAMTVSGLTDAYRSLGDEKYLKAAQKNINFLEKNLMKKTTLYRSFKNKHSKTTGFLDDYAFVIQAYVNLYQVTFQEKYLDRARMFLEYTIEHFFDNEEQFFHFTGEDGEELITRKKEIFDNVIPSSNSVMARNLFYMGTILDRPEWRNTGTSMTSSLAKLILSEPNYMSNWAMALIESKHPIAEVVFIGEEFESYRKQFHRKFHPYSITMGARKESSLPLLEGKVAVNNKTTVFVCFDKTCKLPVTTVPEAEKQLIETVAKAD